MSQAIKGINRADRVAVARKYRFLELPLSKHRLLMIAMGGYELWLRLCPIFGAQYF